MNDVAAPVAAPAPQGGAQPNTQADNRPVNAGWPQGAVGALAEMRGQSETEPSQATDAQPEADPNAPPEETFWTPDEAIKGHKVKLVYKGKEVLKSVADLVPLAQRGLLETEASQARAKLQDQLTSVEAGFRDPRVFWESAIQSGDEEGILGWINELAGYAIEHTKKNPDQRKIEQLERREQERQRAEQTQRAQAMQRSIDSNWSETIKLAGIKDDPIGHSIAAEMREIQSARITAMQRGEAPSLYTPQQMAAYAKRRMTEIRGAATVTLTPEERRQAVRPEDVQARAREQMRGQVIPSAPQATPPRDQATGQFQPGNKTRVYDPFAT